MDSTILFYILLLFYMLIFLQAVGYGRTPHFSLFLSHFLFFNNLVTLTFGEVGLFAIYLSYSREVEA